MSHYTLADAWVLRVRAQRHFFEPSCDVSSVIALQSGPALGPPVVLWVVCCLVGAAVGAAGSALVRRLSNPVAKYRWLYFGVIVPYVIVAYGLLAVLDFGAAVRETVLPGEILPSVGGIVGQFLAEYVTMLGAGVAALATYAPTIRGVGIVREVDIATTTALAQMTRYIVGICALLAAFVVVLFRVVGDTLSGGELVVLLAAFVSALFVTSPWLMAVLRSTRHPTDAETERLARLREQADLPIRDVRVLATEGTDSADAHVRGPPGYRRLFVSDVFLDAFDDRTATALLAVKAERVRTHTLARRVFTVVVAGALVAAAFGGSGLSMLPLLAALAALLVGLWIARRGIRAADSSAAERVDGDTLADAFERYAAFHRLEPSRRRVPNPLSANVALGDRIDRLRARNSSSMDGKNTSR